MSAYRLAPTAPLIPGFDQLTSQLLHNRGLTDEAEVENFLNPDYETGRHDPMLMPNMAAAVSRILKAVELSEKIAIYSDYDCDGIPGAVVLHDFFKAVGFENFSNYIPHRHFEGFGLNAEAVKKMQSEGIQLVITIDCGTSDVEAVDLANSLGLEVIITDHHEPGATLPNAAAIVNPKVGDTYPFKELCGAGVIFKLIEALLVEGNFTLKPGWEKWWLDLVSIATIGDMVPLVGENRVLAHYGLKVLRKSRRPGLQQLLRVTRTNQQYLTEEEIGFTIGPRINAASRMDTPEDAFKLLATDSEAEAGAVVRHLEKLNNERKGLVAAMTKELKKRLDQMETVPSVLVLGNPAWRPSLVGLSANSLSREYQRPVFLWGRDGNGVIKGSCRSDGNVSVVRLMEGVADHFIEYGGHHGSGGFSVKEDSIFSLPEELESIYQKLGTEAVVEEETLIDAELSIEAVNESLIRKLALLSPYGVGNQKPLFLFKAVVPEKVEVFGKTKEHTKITFSNGGGLTEAIAFFSLPESFKVEPTPEQPLDLLAHVEKSFFMGRPQIRLRIVDIV